MVILRRRLRKVSHARAFTPREPRCRRRCPTGMFEQSSLPEASNPIADWAVRGGFALLFLSAGAEKFGSGGGWVEMFQEIGFGDWFRYFTGVVEVLGAVLLLIPKTATAGLSLLGSTMLCAAL